ncbi:conserved Plasmodium protein, unknown function [Babesia microti strain RI]|uniref:Uncharacterized protein n=1 Tax=Babesia microti (strain RI) TaxID=1133968 RepID=I7I8E3_BABMR|nr:conserved Plasmodium protein, unknown function [Babesia microti strain RI]CCF73108.1 conserved Plasmodium protein, unknown function [Babesia microti strain RI]|eukprot:XP_012647717.1 conserved Plasmodium protein, unknown function [Babesia microti strain RI]
MSFWGYGFNHRSNRRQRTLQFGLFQLIAMFVSPSIIVYCFANPTVTKWFASEIIPVYVPPQSDPNIIYKIYHKKNDEN